MRAHTHTHTHTHAHIQWNITHIQEINTAVGNKSDKDKYMTLICGI